MTTEPLSDEVEAKLHDLELYDIATGRSALKGVLRAAYRLGLEAGRCETTQPPVDKGWINRCAKILDGRGDAE